MLGSVIDPTSDILEKESRQPDDVWLMLVYVTSRYCTHRLCEPGTCKCAIEAGTGPDVADVLIALATQELCDRYCAAMPGQVRPEQLPLADAIAIAIDYALDAIIVKINSTDWLVIDVDSKEPSP